MVTFAQFGAGRIGRVHAANIARRPDTELKYVVDPQAAAARSLAEATGALVADIETPFADLDVDAILIASTANTHAHRNAGAEREHWGMATSISASSYRHRDPASRFFFP